MFSEEIVDETVEESTEEVLDETTDEQEGEEIDWEARAKKAEATIVKNKKESKPETVEKPSINNPDSGLKETVERQGLQLDGYAPEVIDEIMKLGGKEALSNPILKQSADALQAKHVAEKATDIGDGPQGQTRTKYSTEDLAKMSAEEMEKVLPHAQD